mgnify:CR=1 FL=1
MNPFDLPGPAFLLFYGYFAGFEAFRGQCAFLEEDFSNIEAVNRGVKSRGFRDVVLNPVQEAGVTHFHDMLAKLLRSDGE